MTMIITKSRAKTISICLGINRIIILNFIKSKKPKRKSIAIKQMIKAITLSLKVIPSEMENIRYFKS